MLLYLCTFQVLIISGAFQQNFFFPYDRRIIRNNDPPFVNKIVIAFKMLGNVVIFMYIPSLDYFWSISKIFFFLMTED